MNIDPTEVNKFKELARHWWDEKGPVATLHAINPLRLSFIQQNAALEARSVLDVGCGGGILAESMAKSAATVTAIDQAKPLINVAKMHQHEQPFNIDYQQATAESFAETHQDDFDIITCMELIEHVPCAESLVAALCRMLKPGGHLFISTLSRNLMSYLQAIIVAEYVLGMLPKGTHDYAKFVKPSELAKAARQHDCHLKSLTGIGYNPLTGHFHLSQDTTVNYIAYFIRDDDS